MNVFSEFEILNNIKLWVRVIDVEGMVIFTSDHMKRELEKLNLSNEKVSEMLMNEADSPFDLYKIFQDGNNQITYLNVYGRIFLVKNEILKTKNLSNSYIFQTFRDITEEEENRIELDLQNKKMLRDIEFARNMQMRMLPDVGMYNGLFINYIYRPSEKLGGDVFDVYKIDSKNIGLYIADVAGHGVTASFLTMFIRQSIRSISKNKSDLNKIMSELLNSFLALNLDTDKYFSIFFGIYNHENKTFRYVNAGQNTVPILKRNGEIEKLKATGYPVCNVFADVKYDVYEKKLQTNDSLIFHTDGIVEVRNLDNEQFGIDRIEKIIKNSDDIVKDVYRSVEHFSGGIFDDDYSIVEVKLIE